MTYTLIDSVTLTSSASSVTFSSIPAGGDLVLVVSCRPTGTAADDLVMQFNGDASNGSRVLMLGDGSATSSGTSSNMIAQFNDELQNEVGISNIMDYSATDKHKTVLTRTNAVGAGYVTALAQRWASNSAITSINLAYSVDIQAGSTFHLYNIAKAL